MEMLTLNHVLEAEGVDPEDVLVIRHSKTDGRLPEVMRSGTLRIFSGVQNPRESPWSEEITGGHGLWLVFVGIRDRYTSRLEGVYRHEPGGGIVEKGMLPDSYPETGVRYGEDWLFSLRDSDVLHDYVGRLLIDWTPKRSTFIIQSSIRPLPVLGIIDPEAVPFPGFDDIHLTRDELAGMYANPGRYESWRSAMAAVQAVYVIACTACGRLYVGSATGAENLWQRWGDYAASGDGSADNRDLARHVAEHPDHLAKFRYSVLQAFAPGTDPNLVVAAEGRFKLCLDSVNNGMNANY